MGMRKTIAGLVAGLAALAIAGCGTPLTTFSKATARPATAAASSALSALALRPTANMPKIGEPAPELSVVTLTGQPTTLEDKRGFGVIVAFFTTWCPACQKELPELAKQRGECGCLGLDVLAVDAVDESPEKVQAFKDQYDIRMPLYLDANSTNTGRWGIRAVPTMFFIDRRGTLQAVRTGLIPADELKKLIDQILKFGDARR
jgi:peroxiredoxin